MADITTTKVHHKQNEFFNDKSRNRWIFGGNRTGKTHAGAHEAVRRALTRPCEGWVVSLSTQVQRDVAQRAVLQQLRERGIENPDCVMISGKSQSPEHGVIDFISINGSRIGFKNCEQGREKFQGVKLDWVWFDEEPPVDVYEECIMRTMDNAGDVWGTLTPLKGKTWLYDRIYMPGKLYSPLSKGVPPAGAGDFDDAVPSIHTWSWSDNPFLNPREIAKMEKTFSTETLESRKFGRFSEGFGLVYKEFDEKNIVKNVSISSFLEKDMYTTAISIDPGYRNPTAVLWFAVNHNNEIFVIDEYKESDRSIEQLAKTIKAKTAALDIPLKNVFIDSAATAQTLGDPDGVVKQFHAQGIPVNPRVDKNVLDGIHAVKGLFTSDDGTHRLYVFEHCVELIKEIRSYFWGDHNHPVKSNDHCVDALRYLVMSLPEITATTKPTPVPPPPPPKPKPDRFEKDKRSKIHENYNQY